MTDFGSLLVNVRGIGIGMPLEGAFVRVFDDDNAILDEMTTDRSGKTAMINLPSPPRDFSMAYGYGRPFARYNLEIVRNGFTSKRIIGVEILEGTTAIQNVTLDPQNGWNNGFQTIVIKEHTLYAHFPSKIPEDEVKPLPPPTGYIVLDRPVIPETIIVHDGLPNDASAPNYYVPFKDYIKNVASCEIFSTWPDAAIRANVLAIISFTLNRVFTEWYRGRGKNFTITSSTAYDHAFSYGRNIFEEISVVVDEIFTTYITRPGIMQPLFTQYCDGRRVQCPNWMTQWGSKDLGDRGYDHLSILRNFYGENIYLDQAEKVTGIPSSFPGYSLQIGSAGDNVRTIQSQLNIISNHYPAIPKLVEDGILGSNTMESVKIFQKIFDMPQTGIVDFATWYRISTIYVAVTRMAELG